MSCSPLSGRCFELRGGQRKCMMRVARHATFGQTAHDISLTAGSNKLSQCFTSAASALWVAVLNRPIKDIYEVNFLSRLFIYFALVADLHSQHCILFFLLVVVFLHLFSGCKDLLRSLCHCEMQTVLLYLCEFLSSHPATACSLFL